MGTANYSSLAVFVELWFMGEDREDHLTSKDEDMESSEIDKDTWTMTDALFCNSLWQSIDPQLCPIYKTNRPCYGIRNQAKLLYTNDIQGKAILYCFNTC